MKYKFIISIFVIGLLFIVNAHSQTTDAIAIIKERGQLIVAMTKADQKPFFYTDEDGVFKGLDVSIAQGIADQLGVGVQYDRSAETFGALIPLVESKQVDLVVSKLSRTLARSQRVNYSRPYITFQQALLFDRLELAKRVSTEEGTIQYVKNLTGSIGVINGSSYSRFASTNFPNANIKGFDSWELVKEALFNKEVIVIYRDQLEIEKIIKETPVASINYRMIVLADTPDNIAIAINKDHNHFLNFVNLYLDSSLPKNIDTKYLLNNY